MAQYDVHYRGSQSHVERVERVEANSVLEAQIKLRDSFREEGEQALIFEARLVQEEAEDTEQNKLNNITNEINNKIKAIETRIRTDYAGMSEKGQLQGLRDALEIIKQYEE